MFWSRWSLLFSQIPPGPPTHLCLPILLLLLLPATAAAAAAAVAAPPPPPAPAPAPLAVEHEMNSLGVDPPPRHLPFSSRSPRSPCPRPFRPRSSGSLWGAREEWARPPRAAAWPPSCPKSGRGCSSSQRTRPTTSVMPSAKSSTGTPPSSMASTISMPWYLPTPAPTPSLPALHTRVVLQNAHLSLFHSLHRKLTPHQSGTRFPCWRSREAPSSPCCRT